MFLTQRKNGKYYIVLKNKNGKKTLRSTFTTDKHKAHKFLIEFQRKLEEAVEKLPSPSLWDLAVKFMRYSEAYHAKTTVRDYMITFKKLLAFIGNIDIADIARENIQSYISNRIRKVSLHQGRKDLINIKAAFNWGVKEGLIQSNPAQNIKRIKIPEKLPVFLLEKNLVFS